MRATHKSITGPSQAVKEEKKTKSICKNRTIVVISHNEPPPATAGEASDPHVLGAVGRAQGIFFEGHYPIENGNKSKCGQFCSRIWCAVCVHK